MKQDNLSATCDFLLFFLISFCLMDVVMESSALLRENRPDCSRQAHI